MDIENWSIAQLTEFCSVTDALSSLYKQYNENFSKLSQRYSEKFQRILAESPSSLREKLKRCAKDPNFDFSQELKINDGNREGIQKLQKSLNEINDEYKRDVTQLDDGHDKAMKAALSSASPEVKKALLDMFESLDDIFVKAGIMKPRQAGDALMGHLRGRLVREKTESPDRVDMNKARATAVAARNQDLHDRRDACVAAAVCR